MKRQVASSDLMVEVLVDGGVAWVRPSAVASISGPFKSVFGLERQAREIVSIGGGRLEILDLPQNLEALLGPVVTR